MYAKNLERVFYTLCHDMEFSYTDPTDITDRFNLLRGSNLLPRGRERREQRLSSREIASAVFSLVSVRSGWAAHGATILKHLHPVGGTDASFEKAPALIDAVIRLLDDKAARKKLVRLRITLGETGTNSNGRARLTYAQDGERRLAHFVPKEAVSLLQPGREHSFDDEEMFSPACRELSFGPEFFNRLAREVEISQHFSAPEGDGSEYDAEEARQRRYEKLGVKRNSRYLNIGVDTQVTWPKEEMQIKFDRYSLVLMPKTKDNAQSVHVDLHANRLSDEDAITVINRFLSVMAWCDDQAAAVRQFGWSGSHVPAEVAHHKLGSSVAWPYPFARKILKSEDVRRALALYREARTAQDNGFVSYAVLNFFKIIEIKHPNNPKRWFRENFPSDPGGSYKEDLKRFNDLRGETRPEDYIHGSCRIAVAHASNRSKSDPDDAHEVKRLHIAAIIMRLLARKFINTEFGVSDVMYSGD
jgi:hypothetical protein